MGGRGGLFEPHTIQIWFQAEQAGFHVDECDFVAGRLCGLPPEFTNEGGPGAGASLLGLVERWRDAERVLILVSSPSHAGKENVYLVASKPLQPGS